MSLFLAWLASISSGIEPIILKSSSKNLIKSPWLFNLLWIGAAYPFIVPYSLVMGAHLPAVWSTFVWLGIFHAGFFLLYTSALYKIDASVMAPLFSLRTVFAVLLSVIVLHEHLSAIRIGLICLIVLVSPLASFDKHTGLRAFRQKNILLAILAMASLALAGYFTNRAYAQNGFATTALWQDTFTLLFLSPSLFFVGWRSEHLKAKKMLPIVLLGILGFIYVATTSVAYGKAYGLSSVIVSLPMSMIFVWLMSRRFPSWLESNPRLFTGSALVVLS